MPASAAETLLGGEVAGLTTSPPMLARM